jgi:cob(I)alamin adenosyltransferase
VHSRELLAMGKRLTAIVTKTGDQGSTGLADGSRVLKSCHRICAIGEIDELNSFVGLLLCETLSSQISELLIDIQHQLFQLGSELAVPNKSFIHESSVLNLERIFIEWNALLPQLEEFILPAGSKASCLAHICRVVTRRAERSVVALNSYEPVTKYMLQYLNRLSDLFFVMARIITISIQGKEIYWQSDRLKKL